VTGLDSKLVERAIVTYPGMFPNFETAIVRVKRVIYFKPEIKTKSKLHMTLGHQTVMGTCQFFSVPCGEEEKADFNNEQ